MNKVKNILLVGVGGQGTILASKILTTALVDEGYQVKMSEIHGMSQRGGSVSTQVRFGEEVLSPIIGKGDADVIVAFEKMEALRWLPYLKKEGKMVINDCEIPSVPILLGKAQYPEKILESLRKKADIVPLKATEIAIAMGNEKAMNTILLGALVKAMELEHLDWDKAMGENIKKPFIPMNKEAFYKGLSWENS